jgi:hypothetical protein
MSGPAPTRACHDQFRKNEGWRRVRDSRGRAGTHQVTYELDLPDGRILRTRVSHPPNRTTYGPSLWTHILRDQLEVSGDEFWTCVQDSVRPSRGAPTPTRTALPAELANLLVHRVGLSEAAVAAMDRESAIERLRRYWSGEG